MKWIRRWFFGVVKGESAQHHAVYERRLLRPDFVDADDQAAERQKEKHPGYDGVLGHGAAYF